MQRSSTTLARVDASVPLGINIYPGQTSHWAVAALLVYDADLSTQQIVAIEVYLRVTYGLTLERAVAPSPPPAAAPAA